MPTVQPYLAAEDRYDSMPYRRVGRSGLVLPALSLGMWHNFGDEHLFGTQRAVLRRASPGMTDEVLTFADVTMDLAAHRVRRNSRDVHLGPTEFRLLRHFMQHPGRVFSREQLLDLVWGHDVYVEPRTVDVHIRRLRKAMNEEDELDLIRTVRSAGYALDTKSV